MELVGWRLSSELDEIPDFLANAVVTALKPVLVFINGQNSYSVCSLQDFPPFLVVDNCHRAVKTAQAEDDRSDDEDEEDETSKEKED
jgi:hypothetical protein